VIPEDILTETELCPVAEHWTRGGLMDWLRSNSIPFVVARSGWPRVHRKALERAMGVKTEELVKGIQVKELDINFDAIK
jgi:hypothetical protein